MSTLPLSGITVVALEQAVAAPLATRHLADLGARVIKVERPGGDFARGYDRSVLGQSSHFVWLNRGKESLELDLAGEQDHAVLLRVLGRADVFIQNLAPGAAERLGLGAEWLRQVYPGLVTCAVSGYGSSGPYREKKAYDLLVQCEAGMVSVTGTPQQPAKAGIAVADIAAGMYAYSGILAALYRRRTVGSATDRGATLEVSMLDALAEWMGYPFYYGHYTGSEPPRTGARHSSISPYGPYRCGDGSEVFVGIQNDREWQAFCREVLGRPELAEDERFATNEQRCAHDAELTELIETAFGGLSAAELEPLLQRVGIAHARLRRATELATHQQLVARDRWTEVDSPAGPLSALLPPVSTPSWQPAMGAIPALGEHTAALRREFAAAPASDGGGFSAQLRAGCQEVWGRATQHRFVEELFAGTVSDEVMARYLVQDYQFVDAFTALLGAAVNAADTLGSRMRIAAQLGVIAGEENTYFQRALEQLGVDEQQRTHPPLNPATEGFLALMNRTRESGDYAECLAVLTVAEWLYGDWAARAPDPLPEHFVHREWITLHQGRQFDEWVAWLRGELDRLGPQLGAADRDRVQAAFTEATEWELAFFDEVYAPGRA